MPSGCLEIVKFKKTRCAKISKIELGDQNMMVEQCVQGCNFNKGCRMKTSMASVLRMMAGLNTSTAYIKGTSRVSSILGRFDGAIIIV